MCVPVVLELMGRCEVVFDVCVSCNYLTALGGWAAELYYSNEFSCVMSRLSLGTLLLLLLWLCDVLVVFMTVLDWK